MKRIIRLLAVFCLMAAGSAIAKAGNLLYGPWVHTISETGFTVLWVTEKPSLDYVELAPGDGTAFEAKARSRYYETSQGRRVSGRYHCVRIDSLEPGKSYRYRIVGKVLEDGSNPYRLVFGTTRQITPKEDQTVRTLNSKAEVCRFSVMNDIHFDDARFSKLASGIDTENSDFILLNGDIVSYCNEIDSLLKHTIAPITKQAARLPIIYTRGNHETRGTDFDKILPLFPTPTGEFWYSFRQGPAAFIVLDAGEDKPDSNHEYAGTADFDNYRARETEWLKSAVKDPSFTSAPVKICIVHIPTFSNKKSWYSQKWITENWATILEKAGIDLMISAHHHKWIYSEGGQDGKAYPVLVNSNMERMDVVVSSKEISIKTYDQTGALCHEWHARAGAAAPRK